MVVVAMVAVIVVVVVVVVVKVPVWAAWIFDMVVVVEVLSIGVLADVEIIVAGVIAIVLKFAFTVSYSFGAPSGVGVDLFMMDASAGVMSGIGMELLAGATANAFTGIIAAVGCPVSTELEGLSC